MNYILAKVFNNAEYAKDFLRGKIYMNPVSSFGIGNLLIQKEDMNNKYRGDLNECLARQISILNMLMLDIQQRSDLSLIIEEKGISPVYQGAVIEDSSLLSLAEHYHVITRKSHGPDNTIFAELVSISDERIFEEYEYQGNRYVRIVVNQDAVLSSGKRVKKGEAFWIGVSKIKWFEVPE